MNTKRIHVDKGWVSKFYHFQSDANMARRIKLEATILAVPQTQVVAVPVIPFLELAVSDPVTAK
jgi:hypothetical protein